MENEDDLGNIKITIQPIKINPQVQHDEKMKELAMFTLFKIKEAEKKEVPIDDISRLRQHWNG